MSITNIRKGIFETNSSSVHVLCINKSNNVIVPKSYTFDPNIQAGWEIDTINNSRSLGSYLYRILLDYSSELGKKEFRCSDIDNKLIEKYNANYSTIEEYNKRKDTIKEYYKIRDEYILEYSAKYEYEFKGKIEKILKEYGCTDIKWESERFDDYNCSVGYIDHVEDAYDFLHTVIKCPDLLINYLFGNSIIYTGNDNDADAQVYKHIDKSAFDYTYTKGN